MVELVGASVYYCPDCYCPDGFLYEGRVEAYLIPWLLLPEKVDSLLDPPEPVR